MKVPPGEPVSSLGLVAEHGLGFTCRSIEDSKQPHWKTHPARVMAFPIATRNIALPKTLGTRAELCVNDWEEVPASLGNKPFAVPQQEGTADLRPTYNRLCTKASNSETLAVHSGYPLFLRPGVGHRCAMCGVGQLARL